MAPSDYYDIKYPHKKYRFSLNCDAYSYTMFSVPIEIQANMYKKRMGEMPETFFDFGCATGEIMLDAEIYGLEVSGVDIKKYPHIPEMNQHLFDNGNIQIKNILDYGAVDYDLVFSNGSLIYLTETELDTVLKKFNDSQMLIAIHNTVEDIMAAREFGTPIGIRGKRIIESNDWWLDKFNSSGFVADYDTKYGCFCARSIKRMNDRIK